MPKGKKQVPEIVEHTVSAIITKRHIPRQQAWAIGVKALQRAGILKKGTLDLTKKGKSANSKHLREPKSVRTKKIQIAKGKKK